MAIAKRITVSLHSDLLFAAILLTSGIVPFVFISVASGFPAGCQLYHEAFHAVMETLGCMMALGIAGFLLMRQGEKGGEYKLWPACAMLSMAILDAFHASVAPGREFVCLQSASQFVGGVLIAMIWLPERFARTSIARELPKVVAAACALFGVVALAFPEILPAMTSNGRFTFLPQLLNLAGGALFLAGLAYFARRFCRDRDNTHLLFTAYCLLFAVAGLTFRFSGLWGVGWWLSHVVRLGAYVVAFGYVSINTSAEYLRLAQTIAERKRAEAQLEELNEHLESANLSLTRANKELADFAHIAAHDLKTPLRAIGTLADWISTDYASTFDDRGKERVQLLVTKAKHMAALIDDILQYSRLGRETASKQPLDLNTIVSEVIAEIAPPENIEITVENELPTMMSGKTHIIQIFQNLVGNAVKYMDKPEGRIKVGCVERDDFWRFSVADNGPGIEQRYFEKIFNMFETLAPRDGIESTGIGLAVVKKLVELNGGMVWVESTPGEGSTFFFTLPKPCNSASKACLNT
jgi:signal transduction histidine kinase